MSEYIYHSNGEPLANERGEILLARAGEIVRCRDCEYYIDSMIFYNPFCSLMNDRDTEPNGFCAWGVRRGR